MHYANKGLKLKYNVKGRLKIMAHMNHDYTAAELAAILDRIERKLDLVLNAGKKKENYNYDCKYLFECKMAGKSCRYCGRIGGL